MTTQDVRELCIESARKYYSFLESKELGIETVDVLQITRIKDNINLYSLRLNKKLFDIEAIRLVNIFEKKEYNENEIEFKRYDIDSNLLILKVKNEELELQNIPINRLKVISDLKFLVENVKKWFEVNSILGVPPKSSCIDYNYQKYEVYNNLLAIPNEQQIRAINLIFNKPFTYIWGPPGTGKTRCVLTYSILPYIFENKKVVVLAPTNNSLEQILSALIENIDKIGIQREKILRIGTASNKFAEMYPEVCEISGLNKQIKELKNQIAIKRDILEFRLGKVKLNSLNMMILHINEMNKYIIERDDILIKVNRLRKELKELIATTNSLTHKFKVLFSKKNNYESDIEKLSAELKELEPEAKIVEEKIELNLTKIKAIDSNNKEINLIKNDINFTNYLNKQNEINNLILLIEEDLNQKEHLDIEYLRYADNDINKLIETDQKDLVKLEKLTIEEKIKNVNIIGITIDSFISRFRDKGLFADHYFLDEAGYVSIVKALTIFCQKSPITFLGDHKQLPPICEMNVEDITHPDNREIILWTKRAIYLDLLFNQNIENPIAEYIQNHEHTISILSKSDLIKTHRFGQNLAEILDDFIYKNGFHSYDYESKNNNFEIYHIDAVLLKESSKRENEAEAEAIKKIVLNHKFGDFIILSPYNAQVKLIGTKLPEHRRNMKIISIHKSQGREWETVIISVTDNRKGKAPFFTDFDYNKQNHISSQVLNTAISRAKMRLILVCDYNFWINKKSQFIAKLLEKSQPLN